MNVYSTRNFFVACFCLAAGFPYPTVEDDGRGYLTFHFDDPSGECLQASRELNLKDTTSERALIPAARLFAAINLLRDEMHKKKGR